MATDTTKITGAADDLSDKLTKGGSAAKTLGAEIANAIKSLDGRVAALEAGGTSPPITPPVTPPTSTALDECINQNTTGKTEAYPNGVPHDSGWHIGKSEVQGTIPPAGWTAVTAWGNIYLEDGQPNIAGQCTIQKLQTWIVTKAGVWTKAQDQTAPYQQINGSHCPEDFSGPGKAWTQTNNPDGSVTVSSPPPNYNCHYYPASRASFAANTIGGCFVMLDTKVSTATMKFITAIGADWWSAQTGALPDGTFNNPGVGQCNWIKLNTGFRRSYFYSMSTDQFKANLPPPMRV